MQLFSDYIQPMTVWLQAHPHWALWITFFISLAESLAIVGSIIPGSVTMTAIGILAGSGVMRIDLTLLAATLGAIAGDGASYLIGYIFSERLANIWPFCRYPHWLAFGKDYFSRHGGKSVLLGRFIGPLRSIIPVIAGMMHMSHWRFFIANAVSAVAWALLYVLPGILIGAASSELSPESATRLFILILILLIGIWLISVALKWLFIRVNRLLRSNLHDFWNWSQNHPHLARLFGFLTPAHEHNHYPTAALVLLLFISVGLFVLLTTFVALTDGLSSLNQPIHLLLQTVRAHSFDIFFITVSQIASPFTLVSLITSIIILTLYYRDWRSLGYWLSLNLSCALVLFIIHLSIDSARPLGILNVKAGNSYPIIGLTFATALFSSFLFYINAYYLKGYKTGFNRILNLTLSSGLILAGVAPMYLGDNWLTDSIAAYLCGFSLSLAHWLFYRRSRPQLPYTAWIPAVILLILLGATALSCLFTFKKSIHSHQPYFAQYVFTDEHWWNQTEPLLPIYSTNRLGHRISLFNIQYAGSLSQFEEALTAFGWQKQDYSLLSSLLARLSGQPSSPDLPLMAQLYLNRKPVLLMTYKPNDGCPTQILRIWRSNYHLQHFRQPLWIGSVHPRPLPKTAQKQSVNDNHAGSLSYISPALSNFMQRPIPLPLKISQQQLPVEVEPALLLIRESEDIQEAQ